MKWQTVVAVVGGTLLFVCLSLGFAQSPTPADFSGPRYSVQYHGGPGRPLYFITDNATGTLHIYENGPKACLLKQSIDLAQTGSIELVATTPERLAGQRERSVR